MKNQEELLDPHLYKKIIRCYINNKRTNLNEIVVYYDNKTSETIWSYNPSRYFFDYHDFIGKTKIEAVFYCDRKRCKL